MRRGARVKHGVRAGSVGVEKAGSARIQTAAESALAEANQQGQEARRQLATSTIERRLDGHRGLVTELAFRPGEPMILASSGGDRRVMLWDLSIDQNTPVLTLDAGEGWEFWAMGFDRSGRKLVATNAPGVSIVWNLRHFNRHIGGNMLPRINAHRAALGDQLNEPAALDQIGLLLNRGGKPRVPLPTDDPAVADK